MLAVPSYALAKTVMSEASAFPIGAVVRSVIWSRPECTLDHMCLTTMPSVMQEARTNCSKRVYLQRDVAAHA